MAGTLKPGQQTGQVQRGPPGSRGFAPALVVREHVPMGPDLAALQEKPETPGFIVISRSTQNVNKYLKLENTVYRKHRLLVCPLSRWSLHTRLPWWFVCAFASSSQWPQEDLSSLFTDEEREAQGCRCFRGGLGVGVGSPDWNPVGSDLGARLLGRPLFCLCLKLLEQGWLRQCEGTARSLGPLVLSRSAPMSLQPCWLVGGSGGRRERVCAARLTTVLALCSSGWWPPTNLIRLGGGGTAGRPARAGV